MKTKENLKVYIRTEKGQTVCMCLKKHKLCKKDCALDYVTRDRYKGWESTMKRDRYGK